MKREWALVLGLGWACSDADQIVSSETRPVESDGSEPRPGGEAGPQPPAESGVGGSTASPMPGGPESPPVVIVPATPTQPGGPAPDNAGPSLISVPAETVPLGSFIELSGEQFLPAPRVILGDRNIVPTSATDTQLTFQVPLDLPLDSCLTSLPLHVENERGSSASLAVALAIPTPALGSLEGVNVPAGDALAFDLYDQEGVEATLGGQAVSVAVSAEGTSSVSVPLDMPEGPVVLRVASECGAASVGITVSAPRPRITLAQPLRLAEGGVTLVRSEFFDAGLLNAARLGGIEISSSDVVHFARSPYADQSGIIAIRVPEGFGAGPTQLHLLAPNGASDPIDLEIVTAVGPHPGLPDRILFSPEAGFDKGTFPVGVNTAFRIAGDGDPRFQYAFSFSAADDFRFDPACGIDALPLVEFRGAECYLADPAPDEALSNGAAQCLEGVTNHPIVGSFELSATANHIDLTIDRTSSGGSIEQYVGGWVAADGTSQPGALPVDEEGRTPGEMILTSLDTGLQIRINHRFNRCPN